MRFYNFQLFGVEKMATDHKKQNRHEESADIEKPHQVVMNSDQHRTALGKGKEKDKRHANNQKTDDVKKSMPIDLNASYEGKPNSKEFSSSCHNDLL